MELFWYGEKVADIPVAPVSEEAPELVRPVLKPKYIDEIKNIKCEKEISNQEAFEIIMKTAEMVDKSYVYNQYDSMVQTNTTIHPGQLDGSVIRVKENNRFLGMSSNCNARFCYIDPKLGGAEAVMKSGRDIATKGLKPLAITDCLNFGNPEKPETMWQFKESTDGIKEACAKLNTPVVSGNVSLYNETNNENVYPTPEIATVGVGDSVRGSKWLKDGNLLYIIGETKSEFGGSAYMKFIENRVGGIHPEVDFDKELKLWDLLQTDTIESAKSIGSGGIAMALYKTACVSSKGCEVNLKLNNEKDVFSETLSRAIVEISPEKEELFVTKAKEIGIYIEKIGKIGGDKIKLNGIEIDLDEAKNIYFNRFKQVMKNDIEGLI
jgi:phosphoribosylformylglycinamidine synthase